MLSRLIFSLFLLSILNSQAEASFLSTIRKILNIATGKSIKSQDKESTENLPIEVKDLGSPPINPNCLGQVLNSYQQSGHEKITNVPVGSKCAAYNWPERSKAPLAYLKGMALVYARAICNPNGIVANPSLGVKTKDALAFYGKEGSNRNTYTLLISMGMRESSGKHCIGKDKTAQNDDAETCEAGLFQSAFNARNPWKEPKAHDELVALYKLYKENKKKCFLDTFSQDITCSEKDWKNWGEGEGVNFQKLSKECPAFAAEFAAISIRVNKGHYGSLEIGETEFNDDCAKMLDDVEKIILADSSICDEL